MNSCIYNSLAILALKELASPERLEGRKATATIRRAIWLLEKHKAGECNLISGENVEMVEQEYTCLKDFLWWRLLPFGLWVEPDGSVVLFDRNYCPIARIKQRGPMAPVHPLEFVNYVDQRYFYEDSIAPNIDPETAPLIVGIASTRIIAAEIENRFQLSNHGRIHHDVWGRNWRPENG